MKTLTFWDTLRYGLHIGKLHKKNWKKTFSFKLLTPPLHITHLAAIVSSLWLGGRHTMMCRLVLTLDTKNLSGSIPLIVGCSLFMEGPRACSRPSNSSLVNRCGYSPLINRLLMESRYSSSSRSCAWGDIIAQSLNYILHRWQLESVNWQLYRIVVYWWL